MNQLLEEIAACTICEKHLEFGPRPILTAHPKSRIVIVGQAPGSIVHQSGIPWGDKSGDNLRAWMQIDKQTFYNPERIALIPVGFCYPGKGPSGDLPPRKECVPQWHQQLFDRMNDVKFILLLGNFPQQYYLGTTAKQTLTKTVRIYAEYLSDYFVLPHPSPRNNIWQAKNSWFKVDVIPNLQALVRKTLT